MSLRTATMLSLTGFAVVAFGAVYILGRPWEHDWGLQVGHLSWKDRLLYAGGLATLSGAMVALVVNYRKQLAAEINQFTTGFADAARQLGDPAPAVRIAGAYALAALADEHGGRRRQCIDALCGYLRLPYHPEAGAGHLTERSTEATDEESQTTTIDKRTFRADDREVRLTIIRIIRDHLRAGAPTSWQGYDFDFTGATFDGGDFAGAVFSGGWVTFRGAKFSGGWVSFRGAEFAGSTVTFEHADFTGGTITFEHADFTGGTVTFEHARLTGGMVTFAHTKFSGGRVTFEHTRFSPQALLGFWNAAFSEGTVTFRLANFSGGTVDFHRARFTGGAVSFEHADFSGGTVTFEHADFSGGTLDFDGAKIEGGTITLEHATFSGVSGYSSAGTSVTRRTVNFRGALLFGGDVLVPRYGVAATGLADGGIGWFGGRLQVGGTVLTSNEELAALLSPDLST